MSKLKKNIEAVKTALSILGSNSVPNEEEKKVINEYTGFGGLKAILYPLDKEWKDLNISKQDLLLENEIKEFYSFLKVNFSDYNKVWESLKNSVLTSFYTPQKFTKLLFEELKKTNKTIDSYLDPCAGTGVYIDEFIKQFPNTEVIGVEIDKIASLLLQAKYKGNPFVKIYNDGFENVDFHNRKFDIIASNIPFGDIPLYYKGYPKEITNKIHNFFFFHSHKLLKEGGFLSFITSSGVFNSKKNKDTREYLAKNTKDFSLTVLPNNFFKESGTEVTTHLFNGIKNTVTENNEIFNSLLSDIVKDDNSITQNKYISDYSEFCYLKKPKIDTNPYGNLEYNYSLPFEETIKSLENIISIPLLKTYENQVSNDLSTQDKLLKFYSYPQDITINSLNDQEKKKEKLFIRNKEKRNNKIIGAFMGNYLGNNVPLFVVSKSTLENTKQTYLIETFIKNVEFESQIINTPISAKNFNISIKEFLKEITKICNDYQIDVSIDFKNDIDGLNFSKYMLERFKLPSLTTRYHILSDEFIKYNGIPEKDQLFLNKNLDNNSIFKIDYSFFHQRENKTAVKLKKIPSLTFKRQKRILDSLSLFYSLNALNYTLEHQSQNMEQIKLKIKELNLIYDAYVINHGYLNNQKTEPLLDYYRPFLLALENKTESKIQADLFSQQKAVVSYEKADIFYFDKFIKNNVLEKELSLKDSIISSLVENNKIDIDYIEKKTKSKWEDFEKEAKEFIIFNPLTNEYEVKEKFLQGNLYHKLDALNKLNLDLSVTDENFQEAVDFILDNIPDKIPFHHINIQFSSRWLPTKFLNKFVNDYYQSEFRIKFNSKTDTILINPTYKGDKYTSEKMLNGRFIYPENIIEDAFYDKFPIKTHKKKIDVKSTNYYRKQINLLKKAFADFINKGLNDNEKIEIETVYNRLYNSNAIIDYSNKLISLEEANLKALNIEDIYPHQKEALWKTLVKGGGLIDHEVGFGKTLTMILSSYYMKKLGLCKKPVITGIKPNIEEIANTYKLIFPNAKILYANEKDFAKKNRDVFFNKIKMNDWDAIVMSHDQLQAIPADPKINIKILKEKIENVEANMLEVYTYDELGKRQFKDLEKQKAKLEVKLKSLEENWNSSVSKNVYSFDKLGIDHLVVDESHIFKNLSFETRHNMVAGIGNIAGSARADKMLYHIRSIQEKNENKYIGASFYSGTPISNSLTELYNIQYYLTPDVLQEKNIMNFDSWASLFTKKSVEFETNIVGQVVQKERFRNFINLPELSRMYVDIAHVMNGENPYVERPDKNEYTILTNQTPLQKRFNIKLIKFLETEDESILNLEKPLNTKGGDALKSAKSLIVTSLAQKASMDMRLINSSFKDEKNNKVNSTVREVLNVYDKFKEQKGTQIIFCDQSVSKKKLSYQELEDNYNNNVFTSLYDDMKFKFMKNGVPEEEIAFIQDYKSDKKKALLSQKMNSGEIRILIGTTEGAGTGLNVQKKLSNIIHYTIPWKPSGIEQRDGRGYRKGNIIAKEYNDNKVDIAYAVTKNTLDNYRIDINKTKKAFINQIRTATNSNRTADEGMMSENTGMDLAELQALLSGDNTLLEKSKVDKQIKMLIADKEYIEQTNYSNQAKYDKVERRIKALNQIIDLVEKDLNLYESQVTYDKKGIRINKPNYFNFNREEESIGIYLEEKWREAKKMNIDTPLKIGEMFGFGLFIKTSFFEGNQAYIMNEQTKVKYTFKDGKFNLKKPEENEKYFINCFNAIKRRLDSNKNEIESKIEEKKKIVPTLNKVFEETERLESLETKSEELALKLQQSNSRKEKNFKTKPKELENQTINFPVIEDKSQLDFSLLWDKLGGLEEISGVFLSEENFEILNYINENSEAIEIYNNEFDLDDELYFIKFEIFEPDDLFVFYESIKEDFVINKKNMLKKSQGFP